MSYRINFNEYLLAPEQDDSAKEKFIDYCKGKVEDLSSLDFTYSEDIYVRAAIIEHSDFAQSDLVYGYTEDTDYEDCMFSYDMSEKEEHLIPESNKDMYPIFEVVAEMKFKEIDEAFLNNLLDNWDAIAMDEYF